MNEIELDVIPYIDEETSLLLADGEVFPLPYEHLVIVLEGKGHLFLQHTSLEVSLPKFSRIGAIEQGASIFTTSRESSSNSMMMTCEKTTQLRLIPIAQLKQRLACTPTIIYYIVDAIDGWIDIINQALPVRPDEDVTVLRKNTPLKFVNTNRLIAQPEKSSTHLWLYGQNVNISIAGTVSNLAPPNQSTAVPLLFNQIYWIVNTNSPLACMTTEEVLRNSGIDWFEALQSLLIPVLEKGYLVKGMKYRSMKLVIGALLSKEIGTLEPLQETLLTINQIMGREFSRESELNFIPVGDLERRVKVLSQAANLRCRLIDLAKGSKNLPPYVIGLWGPQGIPVALSYKRSSEMQPSLPKSFLMLSDARNLASKSFLQESAYELYPLFDQPKNYILSLVKATVTPMKKDFIIMLFCVFTAVLLGLYTPIITQYIYDLIIPSGDQQLLYQMFIGLLVVAMITFLYGFSSSIFFNRVITLLRRNTTGALWDKILQRETSHMDLSSSGEIFWKLRVLEEIPQAINEQIVLLALTTPLSILYLFFMFYLSWPLALIITALTVITVSIVLFCMAREAKIKTMIWPLEEKVESFLLSTIKGISQIRMSMVEEPMLEKWEDMLIKAQRYHMQATQWKNVAMVAIEAAPLLELLLVFCAIWFIALNQSSFTLLSLGSFLAFLSVSALFSKNTTTFLKTALPWVDLYTMWMRSKVLLEESKYERSRFGGYVGHFSGKVTVKNLAFSYSKDEKDVLEGISFTLEKGTFNVLTGPSGCGKTTLLRLLCSLEKPQAGTILYDGKPYTEWNEESLRTQIGVVLTSTVTFQGTIRDNILCGRRVPKKLFENTLILSGVDEVLEKMPMGLETLLTGTENTLSGGERQRIVLARAMLTHPSLLILDEATSALDNNTQQKIMDNIKNAGMTVFMVTHRLEIKNFADHLFKIDKNFFTQES